MAPIAPPRVTLKGERADWVVLGIESSCDDTGAAVLRGDGTVLSEVVASQAGVHEEFGGVKPDAAAAAHAKAINETVSMALEKAGVKPSDLTAVTVTVGPGLALCLNVGVEKALGFAAEHQLPVVKVHHMEAHMMVTRMPLDGAVIPEFPFLTLLVSGGHTMIVLSEALGSHTILGSTIDDSAGEAFDKTARLLGITKVPGGPPLEKLAQKGQPSFDLPVPLAKTRDQTLQNGCDFSFSGLKTAVRQLVAKEGNAEEVAADIAASFQETCVQHLVSRTQRGIEWAKEKADIRHLVVAGGVAANSAVRQGLAELCEREKLAFVRPPLKYCADNGTMVAWTGIERLELGLADPPPPKPTADSPLHVEVRPRWNIGPRDDRCQGKRRAKDYEAPPAKRVAS
jgi:tRNA threonylcarbamoyl adenosine modification protein TsaD